MEEIYELHQVPSDCGKPWSAQCCRELATECRQLALAAKMRLKNSTDQLAFIRIAHQTDRYADFFEERQPGES
jgi:hypothetical protein